MALQLVLFLVACTLLGLVLYYFLGTDAGLRKLSGFLGGTGLKGGG